MSDPEDLTKLALEGLTQENMAGQYCNLVNIAYTRFEFTADYMQILPNPPVAKLKARIITSPQQFKSMAVTFMKLVNDYEAMYGPLTDDVSEIKTIFQSTGN